MCHVRQVDELSLGHLLTDVLCNLGRLSYDTAIMFNYAMDAQTVLDFFSCQILIQQLSNIMTDFPKDATEWKLKYCKYAYLKYIEVYIRWAKFMLR